MPELLRHELDIATLVDQDAGECVAARVRCHVINSGAGLSAGERLTESRIAESPANPISDHEIPVGREGCCEAVFAQAVRDSVHEDHIPPAGLRLQWNALAVPAHLESDVDGPLLEVHILPGQSEC